MNELFLSGTILTLVKTPTTGDTSHVVCQLRHSHRKRQQQVIHETYTVHAWNRLADWAAQTLKPGAREYDCRKRAPYKSRRDADVQRCR